jgi:hypothetical protein
VNQTAHITLILQSVKQMLHHSEVPLYSRQLLNKDIEDFLVREAAALPRSAAINLIVQMPAGETAAGEDVAGIIHRHFAYCRHGSERLLKHALHLGWRSLLIGFVFLTFMVLLTKIIDRIPQQFYLAIPVRELLIILGWVALWRPADLLLYDWYPYKRDAKLFGRLEHSKVLVEAIEE